ncbi:MAG: TRAP transporter small permease [Proteobacteria bacterium]|nr:TRAP transporter small permease [Pseudomonadota bacterium]
MRAFLDRLYRACGVIAGAFMAFMAVVVLAQIAGRSVGVLVRGGDILASFSLVATSFFALAHTLKSGGHIRVALLLRGLGPARRRLFELWCLAVGVFISGFLAYYSGHLVWESYVFKATAIGVLPVPLWVPQTGMAIGAGMMFIAFLDEFVLVLKGEAPSYGYADETAPVSESEMLSE